MFNRNGWWPKLTTNNGRLFVAYGNGLVHVAELIIVNGRVEVLAHRNPPQSGNLYGVNWITPNILTAFAELPGDQAQRYTLDISAPTWEWQPTSDNPTISGGNSYAAANGHWAAWLSKGLRLTIDNTAVGGQWGANLALAGDYATFASADYNSICRVKIGGPIEQFPIQIPNYHQASIAEDGSVVYGGYGPVLGITPNGQHVDVTATPWRVEGVGRCFTASDSKTWISTVTWFQNEGNILLRPFGEQECVIIRRDAIEGVSVVEHNGFFVVASCSDTGVLSVDAVPTSTIRKRPSPPPVVLPHFPDVHHPFVVVVDGGPGEPELAHPDWPLSGNNPGVFCTIDKEDSTRAAELARQLNVPFYAYWDNPVTFTPPTFDGVTVLPMLLTYPTGGQDNKQYRDRITAMFNTMIGNPDRGEPLKPVAVYAAIYRQIRGDGSYALTEQQVLDALGILWELVIKYRVRAMWLFTYDRAQGRDGMVALDSFKEAVRRMKAAVKNRSLPTVAELTPPAPKPEPKPEPKPTPLPDPPVVVPPQPPLEEPPVPQDPLPPHPPEPEVDEPSLPPVESGSTRKSKKPSTVQKVAAILPFVAAGISGLVKLFRRKSNK